MQEILIAAKAAKPIAAALETAQKNTLLYAMADALQAHAPDILKANEADVSAARGIISEVMLDRLTLTQQRIADMAQGMREVARLPDYVGEIDEQRPLENGIALQKVRVPMGVIAMIYESRPNVTADAAALCLKSGNVCILRGGKEAITTNIAIVKALHEALSQNDISEALICLVTDTSRQSAVALMQARGFVDLLIPRGGGGLIRTCVDNAKVPCIETGTGICHVYVDEFADVNMAANIVYNAKTSRPSVCNAEEVCLVHRAVASLFLPMLAQKLAPKNVELRCDEEALAILHAAGEKNTKAADEHDFDTEFLDFILAVKVVDNIGEAICHIANHSTGHSEAIVTSSEQAALVFTKAVDSAAVYVNASTRFTDGSVFGLGCEIGISTQKLGARGPMGLREMTTYKYILRGSGHVR